MKKIALFLSIMLMGIVLAYPQAEVSKRKDITVFPVYSSYNIPDSSYQYFDNQLIGLLNSMKRFQVIGFQYHLNSTTIDQFIGKIQELKKQAALNNTNYMDADLGVVVIPASEMKRLVNSFFIFIPSIVGYSVEEYYVEVQEKRNGIIVIRLVKEYRATVQISVKVITAEGNLLETYNSSQEAKSRDSAIAAYDQAVDGAISGLGMFLRNVDEFKLKSTILQAKNGLIYAQLGKDLGVRPGYEFAIQKEITVFNKLKEKRQIGLIRIKDVKDEYSEATAIFGNPQEGDQLVETPMAGGRFKIYGGMSPMAVPYSDIKIAYSTSNETYSDTIKWNKSLYAFNLGLHLEGEIGYAGLFDLNFGLLINNPLAFYFDIGGGYEFYFGNISVTTGADLSLVFASTSLNNWSHKSELTIGNTIFDKNENINVSMSAFSIGVKPNITFNYQLSQRSKIRLTGGYGLYTRADFSMGFTSASDSSKTSTVALDDKNVSLTADGNKQTALSVDFSGFFGGIEWMFRF